jgi:hypothetical protein
VTKSLGDSSVGRLKVELYKEIKKNLLNDKREACYSCMSCVPSFCHS